MSGEPGAHPPFPHEISYETGEPVTAEAVAEHKAQMPEGTYAGMLGDAVELAAHEAGSAEPAAAYPYQAQLEKPETYQSDAGITVSVERANSLTADGQPADNPPLFFAAGFGKPDNEAYVLQLARQGHPAFAFSRFGGRETNTDFMVSRQWQPGADFSAATRKEMFQENFRERGGSADDVRISIAKRKEANALCEYLAEHEARPVDGMFQSADALTGSLAAYESPHLFRNLYFVYPTGLSGPNTPDQLPPKYAAHMTAKNMLHPVAHDNDVRRLADSARDPQLTAAKPASTASMGVTGSDVLYSNHTPLLHAMREQPDAPGVTVVLGLDDFMKPERFLETMQSAKDADYVVVTEGGHGISYRQEILERILAHAPDGARAGGKDYGKPLAERLVLPEAGTISPERADALRALAAAVDARSAQE